MSTKGVGRRDHDQEMSMEEILASIRKYVTDSDAPSAAPVSSSPASAMSPRYTPEDDFAPSPYSYANPAPSSHPVTAENYAKNRYTPPAPESSPLPEEPTFSYAWEQTAHTHAEEFGMPDPVSDNPHEDIIKSLSVETHKEPKVVEKPAPQKSFERLVEHAQSIKEKEHAPKSMPHAPSDNAGFSALESLAMKAMAPMIQKWLDDNLSDLVEHLVQKEIERLTQSLLKR